MVKQIARQMLPGSVYRDLSRWWNRPALARRNLRPVVWGSLRSIEPVSRKFGFDRGTPIDRHYIERFLDQHRGDVRGRVLEIGDATYTLQFGDDRVTQSDVLHAARQANARGITIVGDLATGAGIPRDAFDCIILTQTLPFIFDVRAAIANIHAALRPGGAVLATAPGISQVSRFDMDRWGDFWRFTDLSLRRLFSEAFGNEQVEIATHGNALAATAFVQGVAAEELTSPELDHHDPDYQVTITARAVNTGVA